MLATALSVLLALILAGVGLRKRRPLAPLPPGPPGYPLIGNALDKAGPFDWKLFSTHRSQWGDMTSVTVLGQVIVILHTYKKAVELLEKKSIIYSSRPILQFFELGGWMCNVPLLQYGRKLRECRAMISQELSAVKIGEFSSHQELTIKRFLRALLASPEQFYDRVEWYTNSIVLKIVYGYDTIDDEDPTIKQVSDVLAVINYASAPGQIIEVLPWLRHIPSWFPGAGFKRKALQSRVKVNTLLEEPFEHAARRMDVNFITKRLPMATSPEELQWIKDSAFSFTLAGIETTATTIQTFFFMMKEYPSVQKEAQDEIDRVIGNGRLPSFEDKPQLPYLHALYKELLRFNTPVPGGVPHKLTADDIHDGFFLPKGTVVISSVWEMSRDVAVYRNPDAFNPARFLGPQPEQDPSEYVFGFGRRACPGVHMAEQTIFVMMSTVLATFDISSFDSKNKEEMRFGSGTLNHPLPFECRITPRDGVDVDELTR